MPRQARLDAPGTLHHVIIRGIEKREIVDDAKDKMVEVITFNGLHNCEVSVFDLYPGRAEVRDRMSEVGGQKGEGASWSTNIVHIAPVGCRSEARARGVACIAATVISSTIAIPLSVWQSF